MRISAFTLLTVLCLALTAPAFAADLYNNGPTNGTSNAYFIDVYVVSDSFVPSGSSMDRFEFAEWVGAGATPLTVDWAIGTSSFGSDVGSGSATFGQGGNAPHCFAATAANTMAGPAAAALAMTCTAIRYLLVPGRCRAGSTYWLTLTNATDSFGGRDGWDINSGASLAYHNLLGAVPSESFTICSGPGQGCQGSTTTTGTTPEPSSIMLFGSGILGLAGFLRRKLG